MPAKGQINPDIRDESGSIIPWKKRNRKASNASTRARRAKDVEKSRKENRYWRERANPFSVAVGKANTRAKELGVESTLSVQEWRCIVEENEFRCHLCNEKTILELGSPLRLSLDHIVPMSRGGNNIASNVLPAHRRCNQCRLDMTIEEFNEWLITIHRNRYGKT